MAPSRQVKVARVVPPRLFELGVSRDELADIELQLSLVQLAPSLGTVVPLEIRKDRLVVSSGRFTIVYTVMADGSIGVLEIDLK